MSATAMISHDDLYDKLKTYLEDMFEKLFEDLDLDSIDAIDLMVKLQELTGRKMKPEEFKTVRTVGDVLDRVHVLLAE